MAGGLWLGVDVEAAEEAVDALVAEAALAQDADLVVESGGDLGCHGRARGGFEVRHGCQHGILISGLGVRVRHDVTDSSVALPALLAEC